MHLRSVTRNEFGITRRYFVDPMTAEITVEEIQDVEPILENNKANALNRGKRITSEIANPIASIPNAVILKWFREEGWWLYDADTDPDVARKLEQKLNDSEWRHLRTSELVI